MSGDVPDRWFFDSAGVAGGGDPTHLASSEARGEKAHTLRTHGFSRFISNPYQAPAEGQNYQMLQRFDCSAAHAGAIHQALRYAAREHPTSLTICHMGIPNTPAQWAAVNMNEAWGPLDAIGCIRSYDNASSPSVDRGRLLKLRSSPPTRVPIVLESGFRKDWGAPTPTDWVFFDPHNPNNYPANNKSYTYPHPDAVVFFRIHGSKVGGVGDPFPNWLAANKWGLKHAKEIEEAWGCRARYLAQGEVEDILAAHESDTPWLDSQQPPLVVSLGIRYIPFEWLKEKYVGKLNIWLASVVLIDDTPHVPASIVEGELGGQDGISKKL